MKTTMKIRKVKFYSSAMLKLFGIFILGMAIVTAVVEFMWLCYYAGIPM